jgi:hypothetical protein
VSICLQLQQHGDQQAGNVLGFAFEFDQLLQNGLSPHRRNVVEEHILFGVGAKNAIGSGACVLCVLGESKYPLQSFFLQVVLDV